MKIMEIIDQAPKGKVSAAPTAESQQGVAEGKHPIKNKLYVKHIDTEQSLIEHAKLFSKNLKLDGVPITSKNRHTVVCSTIFARNKKTINESKHIAGGNLVVQMLKRLDQFSQLPIKVGAKVAIINSQLQGDTIELWGFTTPKTISRIDQDPSDGSIKQFEFNNDPDDVWPRTENAEYNGHFLMYSAFFGDKKSAEHALTMISLQGSSDLDIRNHITEQGMKEAPTPKKPSGKVSAAPIGKSQPKQQLKAREPAKKISVLDRPPFTVKHPFQGKMVGAV